LNFKEQRGIVWGVTIGGNMEVLDPGHVFELDNVGGGSQRLVFLKRSTGKWRYVTEWPGVLCQEVLRALILRVLFLFEQEPCDETRDIIWHLRQALFLFEVRAYRRKAEKVNGLGGAHDDTERHRSWRGNPYADVPFNDYLIERRPVMEDGHIA